MDPPAGEWIVGDPHWIKIHRAVILTLGLGAFLFLTLTVWTYFWLLRLVAAPPVTWSELWVSSASTAFLFANLIVNLWMTLNPRPFCTIAVSPLGIAIRRPLGLTARPIPWSSVRWFSPTRFEVRRGLGTATYELTTRQAERVQRLFYPSAAPLGS
jgi:hypothetical protein